MHKKALAAFVAALALVAFAAIPAVASASPVLTDAEGNVVEEGSAITGFSSNLTFTGGGGEINCTESDLHGVLTENSGNSIKGDITAATFTSNGGGECAASGIFGVSSTKVTTDNSLNWCLESTGEHSWTLRGGTCEEEPRKISFVLELSTILGRISCTYEKASVDGTTTTNAQEDLDLAEQVFQGAGGNNGLCPATGELEGSFTLKATEGGEETTIS